MENGGSGGVTITPKLMAILFIAVIGFAVYVMFAIGILHEGRDVPPQQLSACVITDKIFLSKSADTKVETSCGTFLVRSKLGETLEVQKSYEFTVANDQWPMLPNIRAAIPSA